MSELKVKLGKNEGTMKEWEVVGEMRLKTTHRRDENGDYQKVKYYTLIDQAQQILDKETMGYTFWTQRIIETFKLIKTMKKYILNEGKTQAFLASTVENQRYSAHIKVYYCNPTERMYAHQVPKSIRYRRTIPQESYDAHIAFWKENKKALTEFLRISKIADKKKEVENSLESIKNITSIMEERHNDIIHKRLTVEADMKKWELNERRLKKVADFINKSRGTDVAADGHQRMIWALNMVNPVSKLQELEQLLQFNIRDVNREIATVQEIDVMSANDRIAEVIDEVFYTIVKYEAKIKVEKEGAKNE
tara:strand:- start:1059 stop:1976 length:918 start_codon:yes stop_codon:yes gene_type:complete